MEYLYIIAGLISGILGGMWMGGGTILIPILVLMLNVDIKVASLTNLLCFIPLSIFSSLKLIKNKLVDFKLAFLFGIPCMIFSIIASYISINLDDTNLRAYFGVFLIVLGVFLMLKVLFAIVKSFTKYTN